VVNTGKTKYIEIARHLCMIVNEHIRIGSNSYVRVQTFKYLGSSVINQNSIQDERKFRIKARSLCYYLVQTLLPSRFLSKNLKIKIYITIILPVVLYECKACLILGEEHRPRVFETGA